MTLPAGSHVFRFEALRADGQRERGSFAAPDRERALRALKDRGLFPLRIDATAARMGRRMPARDVSTGLYTLAELTQAGMPVARAVSVFRNVAPAGWKRMLPYVEDSLRSGASLSRALAVVPGAIPAGVLSVITAGEHGDGLHCGLRRAAVLLEEAAATRSAILNALAYPALLATAGTASVMLLVGVVIPRFAAILGDLGQELPPASRALLAGADVIAASWLPASILAAALVAVWLLWVSTPEGRLKWHELLLMIPVIGGIRRTAGVGRTCASSGAMIASGVALPEALRLASEAAGDEALRQRMMAARSQIIAGARISQACADADAMTSTAVQLIRVGEETGELAAMLERTARILQAEALARTKLVVRFVEPTLILVFASLIAGVAAALFQAMYSIRPGM